MRETLGTEDPRHRSMSLVPHMHHKKVDGGRSPQRAERPSGDDLLLQRKDSSPKQQEFVPLTPAPQTALLSPALSDSLVEQCLVEVLELPSTPDAFEAAKEPFK